MKILSSRVQIALLALYEIYNPRTLAFTMYPPSKLKTTTKTIARTDTSLDLIPLSTFSDPSKRTFLTSDDSYRTCIDEQGRLRHDSKDDDTPQNPYVIAVAEEDDLPSISKLTVDAFGADAITLSGNLSTLEQTLLLPGVSAFNAYSGAVAFTEVLSGLRQRMMNRFKNQKDLDAKNTHTGIDQLLSPPPVVNIDDIDAEAVASKSSIILVLGREIQSTAKTDNKSETQQLLDSIATVELRLQPTDAKIPFSEPWFDKIERSIAKALNLDIAKQPRDRHLQPYLSNLCVDSSVRGRSIGKAMCRCVNNIARDSWGYKKIYLHVDLENVAALNLYKSEGYRDVGVRWNPFWAGTSAEIGYYVKDL